MALTEALVGTLLAITLYAIAVRSSMVMRLAVLEETLTKVDGKFNDFVANLRQILRKYCLRLEFVPYNDPEALHQALLSKEVHALCLVNPDQNSYQTTIRVKRLYDLIQRELVAPNIRLDYKNPT